jgi:hypothetical protein
MHKNRDALLSKCNQECLPELTKIHHFQWPDIHYAHHWNIVLSDRGRSPLVPRLQLADSNSTRTSYAISLDLSKLEYRRPTLSTLHCKVPMMPTSLEPFLFFSQGNEHHRPRLRNRQPHRDRCSTPISFQRRLLFCSTMLLS